MAEEEKKNSFASRFKKGSGFKGSADGAGQGFRDRFRAQKDSGTQDDSDAQDDDGGIIATIKEKKTNKLFSEKRGVKKSAQADTMSNAERIERNRTQNIFLVRGKDGGRPAWHYVHVEQKKREMFLAATRSGSLDVADYGKVLVSGWGEDPPESVVQKIKDEYNL